MDLQSVQQLKLALARNLRQITICAMTAMAHLGAPPPEINIKSFNTGLTSDHLGLTNPFAYEFTRRLVFDLREIFGQQQAHAIWVPRNPTRVLTGNSSPPLMSQPI